MSSEQITSFWQLQDFLHTLWPDTHREECFFQLLDDSRQYGQELFDTGSVTVSVGGKQFVLSINVQEAAVGNG